MSRFLRLVLRKAKAEAAERKAKKEKYKLTVLPKIMKAVDDFPGLESPREYTGRTKPLKGCKKRTLSPEKVRSVWEFDTRVTLCGPDERGVFSIEGDNIFEEYSVTFCMIFAMHNWGPGVKWSRSSLLHAIRHNKFDRITVYVIRKLRRSRKEYLRSRRLRGYSYI